MVLHVTGALWLLMMVTPVILMKYILDALPGKAHPLCLFTGVKYMGKITISTSQLFEMFPDAESGRKYLEGRLWPSGTVCPACKGIERVTSRKDGYYRCNSCKQDFTVRTGTIFERSHVPLHKWIYAMYLLVTARNGISSIQLSKDIGITQKSAWFVLHRLREACGNDLSMLKGVVEIDEAFIGGKETAKHASKKLRAGRRATGGGTVVVGMRERGGRAIAKPVKQLSA